MERQGGRVPSRQELKLNATLLSFLFLRLLHNSTPRGLPRAVSALDLRSPLRSNTPPNFPTPYPFTSVRSRRVITVVRVHSALGATRSLHWGANPLSPLTNPFRSCPFNFSVLQPAIHGLVPSRLSWRPYLRLEPAVPSAAAPALLPSFGLSMSSLFKLLPPARQLTHHTT